MEAGPREGAGSPGGGAGSFGLILFLVALSVLFAATLVSTWWFGHESSGWSRAAPPLPPGVWLTTAVLGLLSFSAERGARVAAAAGGRAARGAVLAAAACSLVFLAGQAWNWSVLLGGRPRGERVSFYEFNFYLLTLLHAVHVLGGVVWSGVALARCSAGAASAPAAARAHAIYWHFLGAVWLLILANLALIRTEDPASTWLGPASLILAGLAAAACLGYQCLAIREFAARGRPGMAFWSVLPPFAFLAFWAHAGDWGRERTLARWALACMLALALLLVAAAVHADALFPGEGPGQPMLPGHLGG